MRLANAVAQRGTPLLLTPATGKEANAQQGVAALRGLPTQCDEGMELLQQQQQNGTWQCQQQDR